MRRSPVSAPGGDVLSSVRRGYGHESSVTAGGTVYPAFGIDFAGNTNGVSGSALALLIIVRDDASE